MQETVELLQISYFMFKMISLQNGPITTPQFQRWLTQIKTAWKKENINDASCFQNFDDVWKTNRIRKETRLVKTAGGQLAMIGRAPTNNRTLYANQGPR